jgi:hypothetical protein
VIATLPGIVPNGIGTRADISRRRKLTLINHTNGVVFREHDILDGAGNATAVAS